MTITAKALIETSLAGIAADTKYTAPAATKTIIDKFTATNTDSSARTISIYLVPSGQLAATTYLITKALSIAAGATEDVTDVKNHILNTGDFIAVLASVADVVVIRASGREIT